MEIKFKDRNRSGDGNIFLEGDYEIPGLHFVLPGMTQVSGVLASFRPESRNLKLQGYKTPTVSKKEVTLGFLCQKMALFVENYAL